jgi:2-phospho-L-lactate guanylyltransferase
MIGPAMKAILIPVKNFADSKKRLSAHYSQAARAALAEALCRDFLAVIVQVRLADRVYVASQEPLALEWACQRGWQTIPETRQVSESHSVDSASRICTEQGVTALLRIPIDIPLATPDDIDTILSASEPGPSIVIVPSRDGTGTNALLRSPPCLFPSHFGPNSFPQHLAEAERCGANVKILTNAHIALDVDEPDDLSALASRVRTDSATARWIAQYGS